MYSFIADSVDGDFALAGRPGEILTYRPQQIYVELAKGASPTRRMLVPKLANMIPDICNMVLGSCRVSSRILSDPGVNSVVPRHSSEDGPGASSVCSGSDCLIHNRGHSATTRAKIFPLSTVKRKLYSRLNFQKGHQKLRSLARRPLDLAALELSLRDIAKSFFACGGIKVSSPTHMHTNGTK